MRAATIHGYADRLSVAPGEPIELKVSCEYAGAYRAHLVRLINGDTNPAGPGFKGEKAEDELPVPHHSGYVNAEEPALVFDHQKITG